MDRMISLGSRLRTFWLRIGRRRRLSIIYLTISIIFRIGIIYLTISVILRFRDRDRRISLGSRLRTFLSRFGRRMSWNWLRNFRFRRKISFRFRNFRGKISFRFSRITRGTRFFFNRLISFTI
jgi:hypothetical protein